MKTIGSIIKVEQDETEAPIEDQLPTKLISSVAVSKECVKNTKHSPPMPGRVGDVAPLAKAKIGK